MNNQPGMQSLREAMVATLAAEATSKSEQLPGVNYFDRPATTILAGSVGMISVSFI